MNDRRWYLALPVLLLAACVLGSGLAVAQQTTTGIPCSQIAQRHLLMQDNMRAGLTLIECGVVQGGKADENRAGEDELPQPPNVQVSNRTCTGPDACTHSESMVWANTQVGSQTVVVNYNDDTNGNGTNYSGTSYSLDGGNTFTEILPAPFASGHGTNYGDPLVVYNSKLNLFFAGDLVTACGGFGVGVWSSPDGMTWTAAGCPADNDDSDRPSIWVDNNPFSLHYGRMYVSFNNFAIGQGALEVSYSDNGQTWSTPVVVNNGNTFIRDVQLTGAPPGPPPPNAGYISAVFLAGMNEGGGGLAMRQNLMYRSTDGGNTWTTITVGSPFSPPGDGTCGYFAKMNTIIRHMGWGQPGVGPNGVVHYAYAAKGTLSTGDILYTRSTDNGNTWSTPIVLNDPETNQYQSHWMPSLNVNYDLGAFTPPEDVTVTWYDRRQATSACNVVTDPGCMYQREGIQSTNNGATWGSNFQISPVEPEPAQDDPEIQSCYAGDYDYSTALNNNSYTTWTDGRVLVGGVSVQNVFFANVGEP
ncbi:MAG TPA: sialidase family protein [Bryocella sp.]|nr:sialidase family protein [Bryocella sp.]